MSEQKFKSIKNLNTEDPKIKGQNIDNSSELLASKPSTQPNINYGSEKVSVEEFLPNESKRRATPLIPIRSKTPIDSTRAQTMSQYDLLEASDHI